MTGAAANPRATRGLERISGSTVRWILALLALALCLSFDFLYLPLEPTFPDESRFVSSAIKLHGTGEFWTHQWRAWEMPLMAVVYAGLYEIAGSKEGLVIAARVSQAVVLILTGFLASRLARRLFSTELAATITFAATVFYPFFVFYQGYLLSETYFNLALVAGILFLYRARDSGFGVGIDLLAAVGCFTIATYLKGSLSLFPPLLIASFAWIETRSLRQGVKLLVASAAMYAAALSPWWIRNYSVFESFVPFTTSSARVLYSGNNPMNRSGGSINGVDWMGIADYEKLPELERFKAYKQAALHFIAQNPMRFVELAGIKFLRFWRLYPYAEDWSSGIYKWASLLSYGPVLVLALLCAYLNRSRWRRFSAIYLLVVFFTALHMVFISSIRYRLPLEPFLIVMASYPLAMWLESVLARQTPAVPVGTAD